MDNVFGWQCPSPEGKSKYQRKDLTNSNFASNVIITDVPAGRCDA